MTNETLTDDDIEALKDLLNNTSWKRTFCYGKRIGGSVKPCIRIKDCINTKKNPIKRIYGGTTIKAYQASYIVKKKIIPNGKISHICGKTYIKRHKYSNYTYGKSKKEKKRKPYSPCIEHTHLEIESQNTNNARTKCHKKIRKWERKNRYRFHKINGPLKLSRIQREEDKRNGISIRERYRRRTQEGEVTEYVCPHNDTCFINYGKFTKNITF